MAETPPKNGIVKLVADANIAFSCLLTPRGVIGSLVLDPFSVLEPVAPEMLVSEVGLHRPKLMKLLHRTEAEVAELETLVLSRFEIIPNGVINTANWEKAAALVAGIDERDDHYVALAIQLGYPLWTGDLKLHRGLRKRKFNTVLTTPELRELLLSTG